MRKIFVFLMFLLAAGAVFAASIEDDPGPPIAPGVTADAIHVDKSERTLTLMKDGQPLKTYAIAIGGGGDGPKRREGDRLTPEGDYTITGRNPNSIAHLSLRTSYPSPADVASAEERGEPPGGDIMIHGIPNGFSFLGPLHRRSDWTDGCIAVTNAEMDEIWRVVPDGTPIRIDP
ncbi:MAG TPA: L,D-transpeptidase family protein [Methylomirabilota bacterium]|nr:L,D-transpeptidase family protein [Methylomirabilota bacterium]